MRSLIVPVIFTIRCMDMKDEQEEDETAEDDLCSPAHETSETRTRVREEGVPQEPVAGGLYIYIYIYI